MIEPSQSRIITITRCMLALALCGISIGSLAQAPQDTSPTSQPPGKRLRQAAEDAYLAGARLLDRKDLSGAEAEFAKALKLNPTRAEYSQAVALAHEHRVTDLIQQSGKARLLGQTAKAEALLAEAHKLDPQNNIVTQHVDAAVSANAFTPQIEPWIKEGPALAGPVTLLPNPGPQSFHIHSDVQDVVRRVFSGYGISTVFDGSVQRQDVRFDLEDAPYRQATTILLQMAGLIAVPLDSRSVLIAKDSVENRQRLERQLQETIYIPGSTNEQMSELGNLIRNVFDVKQATVQSSGGSIVIRAPEETITAINLTLADLIDGSEVMLDLKLYATDKTHQRNIGLLLPQQIGIYNVAGEANALVNSNQDLVNQAIAQGLIPAGSNNITIALALIASGLVTSSTLTNTVGFFGGGLTLTGLTMNSGATLNLALNSSETRALDYIQLRLSDRQAGTFRVGSRYPITTSTYSSGVSPAASQLAGVTINGVPAANLLNTSSITIPQIQYEDLGLTLKATPTIQKSGRISMKLDFKIEALAGAAVNNIPILANRQYVSEVTVADGESALLASTLTRSEATAVNGTPGLGELPGFQTAAADKVTETDTSELILLITPHIIRRRANFTAGPRIALNQPQQSN